MDTCTNTEENIGTKQVFRNKNDNDVIITKNKSRLIVKDYYEQEENDYNETFFHVARLEVIKIFFVYAAHMKCKVFQMNVKSTFLKK